MTLVEQYAQAETETAKRKLWKQMSETERAETGDLGSRVIGQENGEAVNSPTDAELAKFDATEYDSNDAAALDARQEETPAPAPALSESGKPFFVGHGVNPELSGMELFEGLQLARFVTFNREAGKAVVNFARFDDDGSIETITLPASSLAGMKEAAIKKHVAALDTNAAAKKTIKAALGKAKGMTETELLAMFRELMSETPEPDPDAPAATTE